MCEFISWIEYDGHEYFLKNNDLETKEGMKLLKSDVKDDLCGHGAILAYYPELKNKGIHKECEDFSTQKNFPKSIAKAIKNGELSKIGICPDVLTAPALAEYNKITAPALAEYNKITDTAWVEYNKITAPARAEYNKITDTALAEYNKITDTAFAEYNKIKDTALAEYNKITAPAFTNIVKQKRNRNKNWK